MKKMSTAWLVLFVWTAGWAAAGNAPGTRPGEDRTVRDARMGISFSPPAGWKAVKQETGYLLGSDTYRGFILIMAHGYNSLQEMRAEAQGGIVDEGSEMVLQPVSEFKAFGKNGLAGEFSGIVQGQMARAFAIGLISPDGGGVTIMAAVEEGSYSTEYPGFVRSLASTVSFLRPEAARGAEPGDASLMTYFAGKYYSYTAGSTISGGAGTERRVMLCANGRFYDSTEFSASGTDWGGVNSGRGTARWSIQGDKKAGIITLTRPNGETERVTYRVTGEAGVILFNGIKFAFEGAAECR